MAFWVDDKGELREGDEEQAQRYGFHAATDEDIKAHNERLDTEAADTKGPGGLVLEGAERGLGMVHDAPTRVFNALSGGPEWDPKTGAPVDRGLVEETPVRYGKDLFPEAHSDEARLRTKAHPVLEGFGTGLVAAPAAAALGALTGGTGLGVLGGAGAALATESAVEAVAQEYDDAWLEKRPMELKNVASYTAMFVVGDVVLRGVGKLGKRVLGFGEEPAAAGAGGILGGDKSPGALGGRNIVAEATAKAERAAGGNGSAARSVGAASAEEMREPFDAAIGTMSDRDAIPLARDADDHLQLVARHSADDWTRVHKGLSDSLGNQLKYRDVRIATDALTPKQIAANNTWTREAVDKALGVAEQIRAGGPSGIDYGAAGKQIASDIERYSKLIMDEPDLAKRFQLSDTFKKVTDKRIMQVAGNFQGDPFVRTSLLDLMTETFGNHEVKGFIREGLENPKYWGHAGTLQKSLNSPWHDMLKGWGKITDRLMEHTGETQFGVMGAGRKPMQGTAERLLTVFNKDQRVLKEFADDLGNVFNGYQRLIEAREAHGIVDKEGLPELAQSIRNLMEDWNLASTVTIARNKVKHAQLNPKKFAKLLALAEKTPFGVGSAIGAARQVSELAGDLHIQKGTPLFDVWDRGLKRYAQHPDLGDVSISANYSPWMQEALRVRGAAIPPPPTPGAGGLFGTKGRPPGAAPAAPAAASGGGLGQVAAAAAKEHGGKVAGAGLLAGSAALGDDNPEGAAGAGAAGLGLLLGGKGLFRLSGHKTESQIIKELEEQGLKEAESLHVWKLLQEAKVPARMGKMSREFDASKVAVTADGKLVVFDDKGFAQGTGRHQYQMEMEGKPPDTPTGPGGGREAMLERTANVQRQGGFTEPAHRGHDTIEVNDKALTSLARTTATEIKKKLVPEEQLALLDYIEGGGAAAFRGLQRGEVPIAAKTRYAESLRAFESAVEKLQKPGLTEKIGPLWRGFHVSPEQAEKLVNSKYVQTGALTSTSFQPFYAADMFADTRAAIERGNVPIVLKFEHVERASPISAANFSKQYGTREREALLPIGATFEVTAAARPQSNRYIELTLREVPKDTAKKVGFVLTGLLGLGAASKAQAAEPAPPLELDETPDPGPAPQQGPVGVYRDAMRTVAQGGEALIRQKATSALRFTPPKGRAALHAFTGRRSLDDAVDAARETLRDLQGDPSALVDRLAGSTGELGTTHPAVYMALVEKAHGLVSYLAAEAPQRTGKTLLDPEGTAPSHDRSLDFAFKTVGALMPVQAMNDVARLDAAPEEVASFQQNWPELWEPLRAELLGQVQRRTEAGRPVDSEKLRQLDALLQMDGQLDPSASSAVAQQMLSAQEQAAPPAQGGGGGGSGGAKPSGAASSSFRTRLDSAQMENAIG